MEFYRVSFSIAESSSQTEIFLIADLRKFHRFSNSIAESPIRKKIFIITERRKFFQNFLPWNCYAVNTKIMNVEHAAGWSSPLQDFS